MCIAVIIMNEEAPRYSAVAGCGPTGCMIASLLRQSAAKARLIAVDEADPGSGKESLDGSQADLKISVKPGGTVSADIGTFEIVFFVFDPTEPGALDWAGQIASRAAADGAYTLGIAIRPPGDGVIEGTVLRRSFGGAAVVDSHYIFEKRGSNDPAMALQIAFNFTAHAITFLTGIIDSGDLSVPQLKDATAGKVVAFAASHISDPVAIYSMAMSHIDRAAVRSGIVFLDESLEDIPARRLFLGVGRTLPNAELTMIRAKGLEPFKILALLAH